MTAAENLPAAPETAAAPVKAPKKLAAVMALPAYKPALAVSVTVPSEKEPGVTYAVAFGTYEGAPHNGWSCTCPDYKHRQMPKAGHCKHIRATLEGIPLDVLKFMIGK